MELYWTRSWTEDHPAAGEPTEADWLAGRAYPYYTEHEKLKKIQHHSQHIGYLIDSGELQLTRWLPAGNNGEPQYRWKEEFLLPEEQREKDPRTAKPPTWRDNFKDRAEYNPEYESWDGQWIPLNGGINEKLAHLFEIDLDVLEDEKLDMLRRIRIRNNNGS